MKILSGSRKLSGYLIILVFLIQVATPGQVSAQTIGKESYAVEADDLFQITQSVQNQDATPFFETQPQTHLLARPCRQVRVYIDKIYINEGGDDGIDGDAEWRLDIFINGSLFEFNDDNVDTGETKPSGSTDKFSPRSHYITLTNDSSTIVFRTGGYEYDDTSRNDSLPSTSWNHGQGDNWGINGQRSKYVRNLEFGYTIFYTISCATPPFADLSLTMTDNPDPVKRGDILRYNLTVTNKGPNNAYFIRLLDRLPSGVIYQSVNRSDCGHSGGIVTCNFLRIAKNASVSFRIEARVKDTAVGLITNRANVLVGSTNEDPNLTNNSSSRTTLVQEDFYIFLPLITR